MAPRLAAAWPRRAQAHALAVCPFRVHCHCHWRVSKESINNKAVTKVILLNQKSRKEEIARMLAGTEISEEARAAAERLLRDSSKQKISSSSNIIAD